jgi:hypothetical protein
MDGNKGVVILGAMALTVICIIAICVGVVNFAGHKYNSTKETIIHICEGDTTYVEKIMDNEDE